VLDTVLDTVPDTVDFGDHPWLLHKSSPHRSFINKSCHSLSPQQSFQPQLLVILTSKRLLEDLRLYLMLSPDPDLTSVDTVMVPTVLDTTVLMLVLTVLDTDIHMVKPLFLNKFKLSSPHRFKLSSPHKFKSLRLQLSITPPLLSITLSEDLELLFTLKEVSTTPLMPVLTPQDMPVHTLKEVSTTPLMPVLTPQDMPVHTPKEVSTTPLMPVPTPQDMPVLTPKELTPQDTLVTETVFTHPVLLAETLIIITF